MTHWIVLLSFLLILKASVLFPFSADVEGAKTFNQTFSHLKQELHEKFEKASALARSGADQEVFAALLEEVQSLKSEICQLEEKWRSASIQEISQDEDPYALWDVGEITLSQLIMEYGASDYLYVIPPELSGSKISLFSNIPLPRESWSEMIEVILSNNGVGVKKLNPFVKQLYIFKMDPSAIEAILGKEQDLELFSTQARLCFVFAPPFEQIKAVQAFFEKFSDVKQTIIQTIGSKIVVISTRDCIEKLIGLYHAVWEKTKGKIVRLLSINKMTPAEADKILKAIFSESNQKIRTPYPSIPIEELVTLTLPQGLVLIGEEDIVQRAEKMVQDLEAQLEDPGEKLIYWYNCKHANPQDVAGVLEKVYDSLANSHFEKKAEKSPDHQDLQKNSPPVCDPNPGLPAPSYPPANAAFNPTLPATAPFIQPALLEKSPNSAFGNFIVDLKTTSILMVVRREELSKIKALVKKLDVPKRMVQLDVLLVEKKLTDRKQIGINLLQIGSSASGSTQNSISFDNKLQAVNKGILSFMFSRPSGKAPAFDLTYNFLMAQEDIRINANPSILAINQTPAQISVVEEISINNGAIPVQLNTAGQVTVEKSYTRAQYGITINLTPTIHLSGDDETDGFVSLETNLEFDTTQASADDRPPVSRRHIENQVCIADGETVILGGLRRKMEEDSREKIPFLGDLPGIGKLFGMTKMIDTSTETFIFITPKIIRNPIDDLRRMRHSEYEKRAGDIPEFLEKLDEAKKNQRKKIFENSMKMLFDMY